MVPHRSGEHLRSQILYGHAEFNGHTKIMIWIDSHLQLGDIDENVCSDDPYQIHCDYT